MEEERGKCLKEALLEEEADEKDDVECAVVIGRYDAHDAVVAEDKVGALGVCGTEERAGHDAFCEHERQQVLDDYEDLLATNNTRCYYFD